MTPYSYTRHNRSPQVIAILLSVYSALAVLFIAFDAVWWLIGLLALFTLPALWDFAQNTRSGLRLDQDGLRWFSGRREAGVRLSEIDHVRLDTRWDFSVRMSLVLTSEKRIRLPDESTPPHRELESRLKEAGLKVERHHFGPF